MRMKILPRQKMAIQSAWLVRALARNGPTHHCDGCGGRMFVKAESGLCPLCYTRRSEHSRRVEEAAAAAYHEFGSTELG